jgi:large subunit ribosomal protein L19
MNVIDQIGLEAAKNEIPNARVGDSVRVHYLIREGDKERVQPFAGTVISIHGRGIARGITVRRLVSGEGVERVFPLHSPRVKDIEIVRRGKVRRAKLYFLRDRVGKQTRVAELLGERARRFDAPLKVGIDAPAPAADTPDVSPDAEAVEV